MKNCSFLIVAVLLILICNNPCFPEQSQISSDELKNLKKDIESLKEGQTAIQKDLQEIKSILQGRQAPPPPEFKEATLSIKDDQFKGNKDAKLVLIEFMDYQWPFCARYVRETLPQIEKEYIVTGKVKYVVKDFPLESIHKLARKLAEASNCAAEQGKFWEMRDRLFTNQRNLKLEDLPVQAQALGLQQEIFKQCLDGKVYASKISGDVKEAQSAAVRSVPTFLLGFAEPQGKVRAVKMITGAQPYAVFKEAIDTLLSSQK